LLTDYSTLKYHI